MASWYATLCRGSGSTGRGAAKVAVEKWLPPSVQMVVSSASLGKLGFSGHDSDAEASAASQLLGEPGVDETLRTSSHV